MDARPPPPGGRDEAEVVVSRARAAVEAARRTVARSAVLADVIAHQQNDPKLVVRCAWCGRFGLGGEWMAEDELPLDWIVRKKIRRDRVTHSICPSCAETA